MSSKACKLATADSWMTSVNLSYYLRHVGLCGAGEVPIRDFCNALGHLQRCGRIQTLQQCILAYALLTI